MSVVVKVKLDALIAGRQIGFPIYDDRQTLLLAAGNFITAEHIEQIRKRGIQYVMMDESDVANATLGSQDGPRNGPDLQPDSKACKDLVDRRDLSSFLNSGTTRIRNTGPALKQRVIHRAHTPYNPKLRKAIAAQRQSDVSTVDGVMNQVAGGKKVAVEELAQVSDTGIRSLVADCDVTLDVIVSVLSDPTLADHAVNTAILGMAIGIEFGLDEHNIRDIGFIGLIQDLGMLALPRSIREARHVLSPHEIVAVQKHPLYTDRLLDRIPRLPRIARFVAFQIHERLDGSGYPSGKRGSTIHPFARILHVADAYVTMTSDRFLGPAMKPYVAMEHLLHQAHHRQVDTDAVRRLLRLLSLFPIGSFVALSDGSAARVLRPNHDDFTRPLVALVRDSAGNNLDPHEESSLLDLTESELKVVQALPTPARSKAVPTPPSSVPAP